MLETVNYLGKLHVDGIKLQLLHVLKGTDLADLYASGGFHTLELPEYLELIGDCLKILPQETVIHRISGDGPKSIRLRQSASSRECTSLARQCLFYVTGNFSEFPAT